MIRRAKPLPDELENGLGSLGKVRIMWFLAQHPSEAFTRYRLGKLLPLSPGDLKSDLRALIGLGWVKELTYKPTKYQLNTEDDHVRFLNEFFKRVQDLEPH
jgi:hypothetical protein